MIKYKDINQGDKFPEDCLICFGKNLVKGAVWSYYILFNSPFIRKNGSYVDPMTFETKYAPTRARYQFRFRRNILKGQKRILKLTAITPVE